MVSLMASGAPYVLGVEGGDIERNRVLRRVRMVRPGIDAQIPELLAAERPARQHALDGLLQHPLGMLALEDRGGGPVLDAAGIAGVPVIDLVGALVAGEDDAAGIDDDDVVATIEMRGIARLVLASEAVCDQHGKSSHHEAVGVDQGPGLVDVPWRGREGLHSRASGLRDSRASGLRGSALLASVFGAVKDKPTFQQIQSISYVVS